MIGQRQEIRPRGAKVAGGRCSRAAPRLVGVDGKKRERAARWMTDRERPVEDDDVRREARRVVEGSLPVRRDDDRNRRKRPRADEGFVAHLGERIVVPDDARTPRPRLVRMTDENDARSTSSKEPGRRDRDGRLAGPTERRASNADEGNLRRHASRPNEPARKRRSEGRRQPAPYRSPPAAQLERASHGRRRVERVMERHAAGGYTRRGLILDVAFRRVGSMTKGWVILALALAACSKEENKPGASAPSASAAPVASTPPPVASSAPSASASAMVPKGDCPKGSSGEGSFDKPCEAKGNAREMEVAWTGKTDDKGPHFRVTNKASRPILYGRIAVFFYDKAGKQLEVKDSEGKTRPYQACGGNIFSGVMKAGEKAVLTFSCVKKEHVPEGTAAIEGEMQMVGFSDATEKKSELYWRNAELAPDTRKKGGVK